MEREEQEAPVDGGAVDGVWLARRPAAGDVGERDCDVHGQLGVVGRRRRVVGGEVEALVDVDAEAEVEHEVDRDARAERGLDAQHGEADVELDLVQLDLERLADLPVELHGLRREDVRLRGAVGVQVAELRRLLEQAERLEHLGDLRVDQRREPIEAQVVLADRVRQRRQEAGPEARDDVRRVVVRERVADERQLDAEDLALERLLDRQQHAVEAVDHDRRIGEQREDARQLEVEVVPVRECEVEREAAVPVVRAVDDLEQVDRDRRAQDVVVAGPARARVPVEEVDRHLVRVRADVDRERRASEHAGAAAGRVAGERDRAERVAVSDEVATSSVWFALPSAPTNVTR